MIYRVRHVTTYGYGNPVDLAAHIVHVTPRDCPGQHVLRTRLICEPEPSWQKAGHDHFGNQVTWLFHEEPHSLFRLTAESEVETVCLPVVDAASTLAWEDVRVCALEEDVSEFLFAGSNLPISAEAGDYVSVSFHKGRPILEALLELNARIFTEFKFQSGVTNLRTPVEEVLKMRQGVCQDFTHLMVSGLRAIGLPARYMSGYIRTRPLPGQARRVGADMSHAWVGVWLGPRDGWIGLDPTNGIIVQDEHVTLGWGRDYADVSPVRGLILGGGHSSLRVGVDLVPVEEWEGEAFPVE